MKTTPTTEEALQNLTHIAELLLKFKLDEIRAGRSDTQMTLFLNGLGCSPTEISGLLGIPTTTVNPILSKARKSKVK
jgi:DNA-directed RNA polymerase specialized sigma24 family protein